jgi:negative regulator of sigma E activity
VADCTKYRELLSGFADNALTDKENSEITEHLEGCASCRALLTVYRNMTLAAEESMAEPPEDFAAGVMQKIKALGSTPQRGSDIAAGSQTLPENGKAAGRAKTRKTFRPYIISLVAAAACLALVFLVSPQLFSGMRSSTATAPQASSAPAAYSMQAPAPAADIPLGAEMKTADSESGQSENVQDSGAGTTPEALMGIMASPAPSAAPPADGSTGFGSDANTGAGELTDYFAVINIAGQLPDILTVNVRVDNGNGTYNIEVTADIAKQLEKDGYTVVMGNAEKATALVVYTP